MKVQFSLGEGFSASVYTRKNRTTTVRIMHPNMGGFIPWFSLDESGRFIKESSCTKKWVLNVLVDSPKFNVKNSGARRLYNKIKGG